MCGSLHISIHNGMGSATLALARHRAGRIGHSCHLVEPPERGLWPEGRRAQNRDCRNARFRPTLEHKRIASSGAPSMMNLNASRARGRGLLGALALLCLTVAALAHPLRVEDMQNLSRVGEVRISPDGLWAVFTVTRSDLAKNRSVTNLWRVPTAGGEPHSRTFFASRSKHSPP